MRRQYQLTSHRGRARTQRAKTIKKEKEHWAWKAAKHVGKFAWDHRKFIPGWPGWLSSRPPIKKPYFVKSSYPYARAGLQNIRKKNTFMGYRARPVYPVSKLPSHSVVLLQALRQIRGSPIQSSSIEPKSEPLLVAIQQEQELQPLVPQSSPSLSGGTKSLPPQELYRQYSEPIQTPRPLRR